MFQSLSQITDECKRTDMPFWQLILSADAEEKCLPEKDIYHRMKTTYGYIRAADESYDGRLSPSGMVGADGAKLAEHHKKGSSLLGGFICSVMERAVRMGECNACMKRIVAAPTAGSCGVLPAVLLSYQQATSCSDDLITEALFVAAGVGQVIAHRACIAGAQGGCQAEIGSASGMAAAALTYLQGGNEEQMIHACALALKGLLGLSCDPVAGLVEVPCVKRNVIGAVNAATSADMAMAGVRSVIPPDEVIDAMDEIGRNMDSRYRETGGGGLAATPTAIEITEHLHG